MINEDMTIKPIEPIYQGGGDSNQSPPNPKREKLHKDDKKDNKKLRTRLIDILV